MRVVGHDVTDELVRYLLEQLGDDTVTARRMFGGHGIYKGGRMFALVYGGVVYMKVTEDEAKISERAPFAPDGRRTFRTFREVSADEIDDPDMLASLAKNAWESAGRSSS
jgi:DNA transformation protein and related proteins